MFNEYTYLYVDDDTFSREIMQVAMQDVMGVQNLTLFADSTNFMERLKALPLQPDIIMLDIHMKPYSGFEVLEMIRHDPDYRKATVIALTASVMNAEIEKLRHCGFNGAIGKPLDVMNFPKLIERILNGQPVWQVA
ncbi:MAG: response regulator [Phototrophicaceae bacterium]|jgi:CheY-like chemotaxis protein